MAELRGMGRGELACFVFLGCLLFALSLGVRMNYGILLNGFASHAGVPYAGISFVIAVGELVYGIAQPLFGVVALRRTNALVLKIGLILLALGFLGTAVSASVVALTLTLGILVSAGTGALCFGIIMSAVSPLVSKEKAAAISGIINASCGVSSAVMSPLIEVMIAHFGLVLSMALMAMPALALLPAAHWMGRKHKPWAKVQRKESRSVLSQPLPKCEKPCRARPSVAL